MAISFGHLHAYLLCLVIPHTAALYTRPDYGKSITAGCGQACAQLAARFSSTSAIHFPENDSSFRIWDAKQAEVVPACRVEPHTSDEVVEVLSIVKDNWCTFAIKGGGHARRVDASNSNEGVTLDMSRFSQTEIMDDLQSAWLGAGLTLVEADRALEERQLAFLGGRVDTVGVAGFSMGGGFSNLAAKMGLAVDNILEYEVILPNGTIANITHETDPDIYYALRGGANNFGIITRFRHRTVPQGQQLFGQRTYSLNYSHQILAETYKLATLYSNDTDMVYYTRLQYNRTTESFVPAIWYSYLKPETSPPIFKDVFEIPYETDALRIDWISNHIATAPAFGLRRLYTTFTYSPSISLEKCVWEIFQSLVAEFSHVPGFSPGVVLQPIPEAVFRAAKERGGNALGLEPPGSGPLMLALLTFGWQNATDDQAMYSFAEAWRSRSVNAAKEMGLWNRYLYINYCKEDQDPFASYGEENASRLRKIQRKVDKEGIFTSSGLNRGYFKLL